MKGVFPFSDRVSPIRAPLTAPIFLMEKGATQKEINRDPANLQTFLKHPELEGKREQTYGAETQMVISQRRMPRSTMEIRGISSFSQQIRQRLSFNILSVKTPFSSDLVSAPGRRQTRKMLQIKKNSRISVPRYQACKSSTNYSVQKVCAPA